MPYYRKWLSSELSRRQDDNSSYSLRNFAHSLSVSPALVSRVLSGSMTISKKAAATIIENSDMTKHEATLFVESVLDQLKSAIGKLPVIEDENFNFIDPETFDEIANWYDLAIRNLADIESNQFDATWVAKRLGLSQELAQESLNKLVDFGLIEVEGTSFKRPKKPVSTSADVPSESIRNYHKQNLNKAIEAIDTVPVDLRDYSSLTSTIKRSDLPEVKQLINRFRRDLGEFIKKNKGDDVYTFSMQLYPLTKQTEDVSH